VTGTDCAIAFVQWHNFGLLKVMQVPEGNCDRETRQILKA